jgi:hypothetical protein
MAQLIAEQQQIIDNLINSLDDLPHSNPMEVLPDIIINLEQHYRTLLGSDKKQLALMTLKSIVDAKTNYSVQEIDTIMAMASVVIDGLVFMSNKGYKIFKKRKTCCHIIKKRK